MKDTNILLVDDDQDTCASMSDIFLDLGYSVDMAYGGGDALELSRRHHYRLALLDYNMPGMNGLELCRRLKISQPSIVVALISAFSSVATMLEASESGVRSCLTKPVNFLVLMPLVKQAVGSDQRPTLNDPTPHAEVIAIRNACSYPTRGTITGRAPIVAN